MQRNLTTWQSCRVWLVSRFLEQMVLWFHLPFLYTLNPKYIFISSNFLKKNRPIRDAAVVLTTMDGCDPYPSQAHSQTRCWGGRSSLHEGKISFRGRDLLQCIQAFLLFNFLGVKLTLPQSYLLAWCNQRYSILQEFIKSLYWRDSYRCTLCIFGEGGYISSFCKRKVYYTMKLAHFSKTMPEK